jgi:hypothetical protein
MLLQTRYVMALTAIAIAALTLAGCAPEAWTNVKATGFNGFLNRIALACKPLMIGGRDIGYQIEHGLADNDSNYTYFLDTTSQLYYGRTSIEAYRSGIAGFLGGGADTTRALDCIVSNLAAERANSGGAPAPPVIMY